MSALLQRVVGCLRSVDLSVDVDEVLDSITVETDSDWAVQVIVREADQRIVAYAIGLDDAPAAHRREVVEFVAMVNNDLLIGNVEIDLDDGEIGVRVGVDIEGVELDDASLTALVSNLLDTGLTILDTYGEAIADVAAGRADAVAAYAAARHGG